MVSEQPCLLLAQGLAGPAGGGVEAVQHSTSRGNTLPSSEPSRLIAVMAFSNGPSHVTHTDAREYNTAEINQTTTHPAGYWFLLNTPIPQLSQCFIAMCMTETISQTFRV